MCRKFTKKNMYPIALVCLGGVAMGLIIISIWTPFLDERIRAIWFNPHYIYKLAILPLTTGCLILYCIYSIYKRNEYLIFPLCFGIFVCSFIGVGISSWPYLIPRLLTVSQAAAPETTLIFMLIGALILLPVLIAYTAYSYYIFRGKVTEAIGYH